MEINYLQQLKQEIQKLIFENVDELRKVAVLNTTNYQMILKELLEKVLEEAESKKLEEHYLIEIRKQWQLHLFFLDSVRITYNHLKYSKLPRFKEFDDTSLPACIERRGSVNNSDNQFIILDERQKQYGQYLEFAIKLEGALMSIEYQLSEELGIISNFKKQSDTQTNDSSFDCNLGDKFMIDPVYKVSPLRIKELKEAEAFVRKVLDSVYTDANDTYYNWLVKSILKYPFPEVEIPDVGQHNASFIVQYQGTKSDIYKKVQLIKREIYPRVKGASDKIAEVFYNSTKNYNDCRVLQTAHLKSKGYSLT